MSTALKRELRVIKSSERTARALPCAYCDADALTMSRSGLITIKAAHDKGAHPAAITIQKLLAWSMPHLDPHTKKDLHRMLAEELDNLISERDKNSLR